MLSLPALAVLLLTAATAPVVQLNNAADAAANAEGTSADATHAKAGETIIVTATRSERTLNELPVSATVVSAEQLRAAPVRGVDDLVRAIPGVQPSIVSSSGSTPTNQRLSMHGLGGTRALVLLDGIPLHDPYSGVVQWERVPMDTLQRVEVVRGAGASLFGTFALGGTINLITRPADEDRGAVDLSYGSFGSSRASLRVEHVLSPRLAVRLTHHRTDSSGYDRVPYPGPVDVPAWVDTGITSARMDYTPSELTHAFLNASAESFDVSQGTPLTYSRRNGGNVSAGMDHASERAGSISVKLFHQRLRERLVNSSLTANRQSEFLSQDAVIPSESSGGSVEWSHVQSGPIPFVSIGADVRGADASESRVTFDRTGKAIQRNQLVGRQRFAGVYAQASWQPAERVEVLASARVDSYRNENGSDSVLGGARTDFPSASSRQFDPRVSVRWATGVSSAIRGSVYRGFNAPTLRDLYRSNQSGNSLILGNPYLEPETLTGGEIGWEWAGRRGRVEMNLYRNEIKGLQSRAPLPGQPPNVFHYVNLGAGRSQGVETTATFTLASHWSIDAGYAHADSVVTVDPSPALIGNRLPEVPRDSGALSLRYHGDRGTTADVRARAEGRSYGDANNTAISPAHRIVDVSLSQRLREGIDLYLVVENVFDELYYQALTPSSFRNGLPRSVTVGFRMNRTLWSGR